MSLPVEQPNADQLEHRPLIPKISQLKIPFYLNNNTNNNSFLFTILAGSGVSHNSRPNVPLGQLSLTEVGKLLKMK